MISSYKPKAHNELYLKPTDYIFSAPINILTNSANLKSLDNFIRGKLIKLNEIFVVVVETFIINL